MKGDKSDLVVENAASYDDEAKFANGEPTDNVCSIAQAKVTAETDSQSVQNGIENEERSELDFITDCGREFRFSQVDDNCQKLIEKISGEKCLRCNGYSLFESFPTFLKDFLNLEIRDDDVWVCSFPRSGKMINYSLIGN